MRIEGNNLFFKSSPRYYYREKCGVKNNTARTLNLEESISLMKLVAFNKKELNICIENPETQERFTRHLTDISTCPNGDFLIFSWDPNSGGNF